MRFLICVVFMAVFVVSSSEGQRYDNTIYSAPYIIPCSQSDPELNTCIKQSFNHLRPYLVTGISELNVQPIDPLHIPYMGMENGNGAVKIKASFLNMTAYGAGNYSITKVKADIPKLRIDLGVRIPKIEVSGQYDVAGQVLLFPVKSRGDFWATFGDVAAIGRIFGKAIERDGIKYMMIEKLLIDFKLKKSKFKIRDEINGDNVIGEAMNQFLNNNADEIITEMKPTAAQSISKHFKQLLNSAFLQIPLDAWLKE